MAITNNVQLIEQFDANMPIQSPRLFLANTPQEHAAQCVAVETCRSLMAGGFSIAAYNDMTGIAWYGLVLEAVTRAAMNLSANIHALELQHAITGADLGGNFFEHGYTTIMGNTQQSQQIQFTKTGGVS